MEARSMAEALILIMERNGWSQSRLARELGVSQPWVSDIRGGKKDTRTRNAAEKLSRVGWELVIRPIEEDPVRRREFVASVASVAFVPSATTNGFQDPEYVGILARRASRARHEFGGLSVLPTLMSQVQRAKSAALNAKNDNLNGAVAELAAEAMFALSDAKKLDEARRVGGLALGLARHAKDYSRQADIYTCFSKICAHENNGAQAAMYAEQALHLPNLSAADTAYVRVRFGRALALVSDQERKARFMLDQAVSIDNVPDFESVDVLGNVAVALSDLGRRAEAYDLLAKTSERMGQWSPLVQADHVTRLTRIALDSHEIELAAIHMQRLARVLPTLASVTLQQGGRDILAASRPWVGVREVRDAREQLRLSIWPENST